jgi:hypothetical protein
MTPSTRLPPRGDPQRPIELAIRSTRLLGFASTAFGLVMVLVFGYFNRFLHFRKYFIGLGMVVWFVPGVLFLMAWWFLRRRSRAAVLAALATAGVQLLFAVAILIGSLTVQPVSPVPVLLCVLWAAALAQLVVHLRGSLESVRVDTAHVRGFEALGAPSPKPVLPLHAGRAPSANAATVGGADGPAIGVPHSGQRPASLLPRRS